MNIHSSLPHGWHWCNWLSLASLAGSADADGWRLVGRGVVGDVVCGIGDDDPLTDEGESGHCARAGHNPKL